jgi:hypothetical protein
MGLDSSEEVVLSYMKTQNRPYSVQNVFDNLRGELSKSKVSFALDVCPLTHISRPVVRCGMR